MLYVCVHTCAHAWFPFFNFIDMRLFISCVFMSVGNSLGWSSSSSTFCRAKFRDRYCLNLTLLWSIVFSPSTVIENIANHSNLDWLLWILRVCNTYFSVLLKFRVSIGMSGVFLIGLPLFITWSFFLEAFIILPLLCIFSVLIVMW